MQRDQAQKQLELLKRIAVALEKDNVTTVKKLPFTSKDFLDAVKVITDDYASKHKAVTHADIHNAEYNDISGFEGTLKDLHNLKLHTDEGQSCDDDHVHNDYLNDLVTEMTKEQYIEFCQEMSYVNYDLKVVKHCCSELEYEECLGAIKQAQCIIGEPDEYTYDNNLREFHCGVVNDSDFNIRKTADSYQAALDCETHFTSKKECIMDYITNEFGILGARYTDIIKFAYYLGSPNAPKYDNSNRGYYSQGFSYRTDGHLITGGKDQLVKGINKEGDEKYFALSFVDSATDYWKRLDNIR